MNHERFNIANWVKYWATVSPGKTALIFEGEKFAYARFYEHVLALTGWLEEKGLSEGDRLAVYMTNSPLFLLLFLACSKLGVVFVPLNFRLAVQELIYILENAEPKILVFSPSLEESVGPIQEALPDLKSYAGSPPTRKTDCPILNFLDLPKGREVDRSIDSEATQVIMYTSGTTGFPKGAMLPYRKTFYNVLNAQFFLNLGFDDSMIIVLPLFHSGGLFIGAASTLYCGGTIHLEPKFRIEGSTKVIREYGITKLVAVPAIYRRILAHIDEYGGRLKSLKTRMIGGERVDHELMRSLYEQGLPVRQIFGQTETSITLWGDEDVSYRYKGSVGYPVFHGEIGLLDEKGNPVSQGKAGEIVIKGPLLMKGYWRDPVQTQETLKEGWLHTGDLARQDEAGRYYVVGRGRDVYMSGGENVYPPEVERALYSHPEVADVSVIGVPDEQWGETGMAYVVKKEGSRLGEKELLQHCSTRIAKYKMPRHIHFISELPKTALGKTRKYLLKAQLKKNAGHESN